MTPRAFIEGCLAVADDHAVTMAPDLREYLALQGRKALAELESAAALLESADRKVT